MDIRKWLDETELPARPPGIPEQLDLPHFLRPKDTVNERPPTSRRRRKRTTSDSSILEAPPKRSKARPITAETEGDDSSASSGVPTHSHLSSGNSTSSCRYACRPRRKTRLERYEPKERDTKGRGKDVYAKEKDKSGKRRRKSRRKTEKPGKSQVQNFQAKNVPKDRLTLRPRENLGLFNKGRASSPARRRGLPDLVFSEMKFLQKQTDEPEPRQGRGAARESRRKDRTKARQEEISAYFTSARPFLAEKDANTSAQRPRHGPSPVLKARHHQRTSPLADDVIPTIELPEKSAYLGFGSRGPHYESASYISWSESARAPSLGRPRRLSSINDDQQTSIRSGQHNGEADAGFVPPPTNKSKRGVRDEHQFNDSRYVSSTGRTNRRSSRSHSFPVDLNLSYRNRQRPDGCKRNNERKDDDPPLTAPASGPVDQGGRMALRELEVGPSPQTGDPDVPLAHASLEQHGGGLDRQHGFHAGPQLSILGRLLRECETVYKEMRQSEFEKTTANGVDIPSYKRKREEICERPAVKDAQNARGSASTPCPTIALDRPSPPDHLGPPTFEEQLAKDLGITGNQLFGSEVPTMNGSQPEMELGIAGHDEPRQGLVSNLYSTASPSILRPGMHKEQRNTIENETGIETSAREDRERNEILSTQQPLNLRPTVPNYSTLNSYPPPTLKSLFGPGIYEQQAKRYALEGCDVEVPSYIRHRGCENVGTGLSSHLGQGWDVEPEVPDNALFPRSTNDVGNDVNAGRSIVDGYRRYRDVRHDEVVEEGNGVVGAGFWRPHRLY